MFLARLETIWIAGDGQIESLMQLLVFVIVIALWVVGALVKGKGSSVGRDEETQPEGYAADEQRRREQEKFRRLQELRLQLGSRFPQIDAAQPVVEEISKASIPAGEAEDTEIIKEPKTRAILEPAAKIAGSVFESDEEGLEGVALEMDDAEELRKAILYAEVIGRPIGLRGRDEGILGFRR